MPNDRTILIVDDSLSSRRTIRRFAEALGLRVVGEGENGEQAVQLYKEHKPSIVTLDIVLPVMDGITVARILKAFDKDAVLVMCSSISSRERAMAAKTAGAVDFLLKPVDEARFNATIARLLGTTAAPSPAAATAAPTLLAAGGAS